MLNDNGKCDIMLEVVPLIVKHTFNFHFLEKKQNKIKKYRQCLYFFALSS